MYSLYFFQFHKSIHPIIPPSIYPLGWPAYLDPAKPIYLSLYLYIQGRAEYIRISEALTFSEPENFLSTPYKFITAPPGSLRHRVFTSARWPPLYISIYIFLSTYISFFRPTCLGWPADGDPAQDPAHLRHPLLHQADQVSLLQQGKGCSKKVCRCVDSLNPSQTLPIHLQHFPATYVGPILGSSLKDTPSFNCV